MRIAFMGTPDFSVPALVALHQAGHEIAAVYTQPPRPAGRGKKERPSAVHLRAEELGLDVRHPVTLRDATEQGKFTDLHLDAAVVVAYGLILPAPVLAAPTHGSPTARSYRSPAREPDARPSRSQVPSSRSQRQRRQPDDPVRAARSREHRLASTRRAHRRREP